MPSIVFSLGLSAAMAGPAQDIAREFRSDMPPPAFGLACSPIRQAVQLADSLGSFSSGAVRPELQLLLDAARDPSVEQVDGINVDGGFSIVSGPGGATASLPMNGDLQAAMALFAPKSKEASGWTKDAEQAVWMDEDGIVRTLTVDGQHARLQVAPSAPSQGGASGAAPDALLRLPDEAGCAVWVEPSKRSGEAPTVLRSPIAVWIPFQDSEPMQINMSLPAHRDRAQSPSIRAPLSVSSAARPHAVMTLGVPIMSILRDPFVLDSLPPAVRERLPEPGMIDDLGAGMVVATFMGPSGPSVLAALPIETDAGRPVSARRIWKVTSRALEEVQVRRGAPPPERIGRRALQVQVTQKHSAVLQAARGRLYMGNVRSQVESMIEGDGEPWLTPDQVRWSEDHAVAAFADAPLPSLSIPLSITLGAGTEGNLMNVKMMMDPGLQDAEVAAALRAFAASRKARGKTALPLTLPE
ncbi:MAG TPA: hypothetical protein DFR83_07105 [Deltaproteobacteria bacterium]|nr:hypothetical protein [Deltaproteobacteria bacterium]